MVDTMKLTMVIPSYWGRESEEGWKEGDAVYDHPTPLDCEGTLARAIESLKILKERDFKLVILAVATSSDIEAAVEAKVKKIIRSTSQRTGLEVLLFAPSHLAKIDDLVKAKGGDGHTDLLQLRGYSNIRNLCMFIPHVLGSDLAVLIDDDEVFEDPDFITKSRAFIGKDLGGKRVNAVAGYYLQPDGDYHIRKEHHPWMDHWDKYRRMNEAFDRIIGSEPRLKETPFVFGGNMLIHRDLFTIVPFDPNVTRGEDIDFLINAKIFGFRFFLDNKLSIKHLPPPKSHPRWKQLREDIYRFVYERIKIKNQKDLRGLTWVSPEEFDPYPGCFLKDDLLEKVERASKLLSEDYLKEGNHEGSREALKNITLAKGDAVPRFDPFRNLCEIQKRWQDMMEFTAQDDIRLSIQAIIEERGE